MPLKRILTECIENEVFAGAVVLAGDIDNDFIYEVIGMAEVEPEERPMTEDTIFDLASLTKVVVITTLTLIYVETGKLRLDDTVVYFLPDFPHENITIRQLLSHTSGLPAWAPLFLLERDPLLLLYNLPQENPPGMKVAYSCMGFILLGRILELIGGADLSTLAEKHICRPLGMERTGFKPKKGPFATTEVGNIFEQGKGASKRDGPMRGVVHDGNAYSMGGVAGNAGLFAPASDMARFARFILRGGEGILTARSIELMATRQTPATEEPRGLGWYLPGLLCSGGDLLGPGAMGHTGFTGTALWIDPRTGLFGVLLTNRLHPRYSEKFLRFRPLIYNCMWRQMMLGDR